MNARDITKIAKSLNAAHGTTFGIQSAATVWAHCIEAVADAIATTGVDFDRVAFLRECRACEPVTPTSVVAALDGDVFCRDCGEPGERTGHQTCQYPQDHH